MRLMATGKMTIPLCPACTIPGTSYYFACHRCSGGEFLDLTIYGRYLRALGRNEQAARFSGINSRPHDDFGLCDLLALGRFRRHFICVGCQLAQPSDFGNFYELYAIAAAVLGGCSLRGGEGTVIGCLSAPL